MVSWSLSGNPQFQSNDGAGNISWPSAAIEGDCGGSDGERLAMVDRRPAELRLRQGENDGSRAIVGRRSTICC